MINIYIDDSGISNLKEEDQPVFLFSAVLIDNMKISSCEKIVTLISKEMEINLQQKLMKCMLNGSYDETTAKKIVQMIYKKLAGENLEIHCSKLIRGDDEYMIFQRDERVNYVKDTLEIISKNDIPIITVYCTKNKYKSRYEHMDIKERQSKAEQEVIDILLSQISQYLKSNQQEGCIIVDKGNNNIKKFLIPKIKSNMPSNINSEILEKDSCESPLIQIADACAYTNYMYHSSVYKKIKNIRDKYKEESSKLYPIIQNNNIAIDIADIEVKVEKI